MELEVIVPVVDGVEVETEAELLLADGDTAGPTPTQYETPTWKFVSQSELTAGFQARNCSWVMPNACSTLQHESPSTTSYHLLQLLTVPVMVGLSGLVNAGTELVVVAVVAVVAVVVARRWWCCTGEPWL